MLADNVMFSTVRVPATLRSVSLAAAVAVSGLAVSTGMSEPVKAAEAEYQIKMVTGCPPVTPQCRTVQWWMNDIEERTDGRVEFQPFWGGSLVKSNEILSAVEDGVAQMGMIFTIEFPSALPLAQIGNLPFQTRDPYVMQQVMRDLIAEFPVFEEELRQNNAVYLGDTPTGGTGILSKSPVETLEDMDGNRTFTLGLYSDTVRASGANPVSLTWTELYEALQRGVVDSAVMYPMSIRANKFNEVTSHFTYIGDTSGLGQDLIYTIMNKDYWDSLPTDIQETIQSSLRRAEDKWIAIWRDVMESAMPALEAGDDTSQITFHELPEEDVEEWKNAVGDPLERWAEENSQLADTQAIVERYRELEAKYERQLEQSGYPEAP